MGKKEIEDAIDKLKDGDNVAFINTMKVELDDELANDETFQEFGNELDKYSKLADESDDDDDDEDDDGQGQGGDDDEDEDE